MKYYRVDNPKHVWNGIIFRQCDETAPWYLYSKWEKRWRFQCVGKHDFMDMFVEISEDEAFLEIL